MHWIDEATVEGTWHDVSAYSVDEAAREMTQLGERQPELLAFVMVSCEDLDEEARELAVYMFFVLYRMFETAYHKSIPYITTEQILRQHDETEQLMSGLDGSDEGDMALAAMREASRQPWVMQYVVETLMEAPEGDEPVTLSEEEFGEIFLVLKTVIDVLDYSTERT